MKIALCLYGHLRDFDNCYSSLYEKILKPYNPDIFAMTWTDSFGKRSELHSTSNQSGIDNSSAPPSVNYIFETLQKLNPVRIHLDTLEAHEPRFETMYQKFKPWHLAKTTHKPKSMFGMNWGRHCVIKIKSEQEKLQGWKYDLVIATRWDMKFLDIPPLETLDRNKIIMHRVDINNHILFSDYWVSGSSYLMDIWGDQFNNIEGFAKLGYRIICPHIFAQNWLEWNKIDFEYNENIKVIKSNY